MDRAPADISVGDDNVFSRRDSDFVKVFDSIVGETVPDILNCDALARLYDVELSDLLHHDQEESGITIAPKGKHIFGTVRVGERGQVVIPKQARDLFAIKPGDILVVLGDESPEHPGLAMMKEDFFLGVAQLLKTAMSAADTPEGDEKK